MYDRKRISSIFLIVSALLGIFSLLGFILSSPPNGYQISIYQHTPFWAWSSISIGFVLLLFAPILGPTKRFHWFGILFLHLSIIGTTPWLVGYYEYFSADAFYHLGTVTAIKDSGVIPERNFYPLLHILGATISEITGIRTTRVTIPVLLGFGSTALLSSYAILRQHFTIKRVQFGALAIVALLLLGAGNTNYVPWSQSRMMIPLGLYLIYKVGNSDNKVWVGLTTVFVVFSVSLHPLFGLSVFVMLLSLFGISNLNFVGTSPWASKHYGYLAALSSVVVLNWMTVLESFLRSASPPILSIVAQDGGGSGAGGVSGGDSFFQTIITTIQSASPQIFDLIEVGVFRYGRVAIVAGAAGLMAVGALSIGRLRNRPIYYTLFVFSIPVLGVLALLSMFLPLPIGFTRFLSIAAGIGAITVAVEFFEVQTTVETQRFKNGVSLFVIVCVVFVVLTSPFMAYNSTMNKMGNQQVTQLNMEGTNWLVEYQEESAEVSSVGIELRRHSALSNYGYPVIWDTRAADHFGYGGKSVWTSSSDYLFVAEKAQISYPSFYPSYRSQWAYTPGDFARLEVDNHVNKVYTNKEAVIYSSHRNNSAV